MGARSRGGCFGSLASRCAMRRLAADSVTQFPPTFPPQHTALHSYIRVFVYPHAFRIPLNIQPIFLDIFHLGRYNQYPFLPSGRIFTNIATASNHQSFLRPVRIVPSVIATAPPVHPRGERERHCRRGRRRRRRVDSSRLESSRATVVVSGVEPRLDAVVRSRLPCLGDAMRRVLLATCASCSTRLEVVVSSRLAETKSLFHRSSPSFRLSRTTLYPKVTSYMYTYIYIYIYIVCIYTCIYIYRHARTLL